MYTYKMILVIQDDYVNEELNREYTVSLERNESPTTIFLAYNYFMSILEGMTWDEGYYIKYYTIERVL